MCGGMSYLCGVFADPEVNIIEKLLALRIGLFLELGIIQKDEILR